MINYLWRSFLLLTLFGAIFLSIIIGFAYSQLTANVHLDKSLVWKVEKGSNLSVINHQLHVQGLVSRPELMALYARIMGKAEIQAGEYRIEPFDTPLSLVEKFNRGDVIVSFITFPEGWTFRQWLDQLSSVAQFDKLNNETVKQVLIEIGLEDIHPEGWFFPDTYSYTASDTALDILKRAHQKMQAVLEQSWVEREENLPYKSAYEALIMASIIERETGVAAEREEIAGVFVRRLQRNMRLQTDPTVIYGLGDAYKGNIRRTHLRQATPYNTYVIKGLPPTPIAMPGRASIEAALHPAPGTSLYFVAKGDGSHQFSSTLSEHREAVEKYQIRKRAKNYHSSPKHSPPK